MKYKTLIKSGINTYYREGLRSLLIKSASYVSGKLSPRPAVANKSTLLPFWLLKYLYNLLFIIKHGRGVKVMDEDWDTLILLDACRYDDFEKVSNIQGKLSTKISRGVDSHEFIQRNFVDEQFWDTVYVTANPHVKLIDDTVFHDVITDPISKWDSHTQCVPPEAVTETAIEAHRTYPNKRIIVHYMQPHDPPLGPTANELRQKAEIGGTAPGENEQSGQRIMELIANGEIPEETAHEAYRETLEIALEEATSLIDAIDGKIVISADHGEMFGESPYPLLGKLYEHYRNPKTLELCEVPWFVVSGDNQRRKIKKGSGENNIQTFNDEVIENQLEALGYK